VSNQQKGLYKAHKWESSQRLGKIGLKGPKVSHLIILLEAKEQNHWATEIQKLIN